MYDVLIVNCISDDGGCEELWDPDPKLLLTTDPRDDN
jgi:hypothetical protein